MYYSLQSLGDIPRDNPKDAEKFRIFVIVDEAKLLVSQKQKIKAVINKYTTELRKYGVGLIMASQIISHFNEEILSNIAMKFCMKSQNQEQAKKNDKFFKVEIEELLNLKRGEGILVSNDKNQKLQVIPSWER